MHIKVNDASIAYKARIVFEEFNATFEDGVVTALVGPSGSGKSSLLSAMGGYQRLAAGQITVVQGTDHLTPDPTLVAWVPQGSNALKARTVLDNVCVAPLAEGKSLADARAISHDALHKVGLVEHSQDTARTLSGGELQRLAFARALASTRPLLFADEPSASLDEKNTRGIAQLLQDLNSTATIVVATHDPVLIDSAGAVVSIRTGPTHAP